MKRKYFRSITMQIFNSLSINKKIYSTNVSGSMIQYTTFFKVLSLSHQVSKNVFQNKKCFAKFTLSIAQPHLVYSSTLFENYCCCSAWPRLKLNTKIGLNTTTG